ncbi:TPA: serine/threonine protein kinase [Candidatus Scatousia excrementigallinarum]|uniref:Serine/threonine protein kinase n=1 Tax=Candidatus Scatousia excrementigallinarum TaxID=2840935 RepID=A0A9D1JN81_9BACT|nr:serine/threonine protein kinase [Candidatus Scatousia excrementigallinarum]
MRTLFKGTVVHGQNGNTYKIIKLISQGTGQGDIYKVINARKEVFAFKLFHSGTKDFNQRLIERLMRRGQVCEAFVTPLDIVEVDDRIGYIMEYIGLEYVSAAVLCNGIEKNGIIVNLPWGLKLALLARIVESFIILSNANLGIIDIKFDNIKLDLNNCQIKILDTDTIIHVNDKASVRGTVSFMPPDVMTKRKAPDKDNDSFAIPTIIFMSLYGSHPLDGKRRLLPCNENIDMYLFGTHPVYVFNPTDSSNRPLPQDEFGRNQQQTIDKHKKYPDYLKKAMEAVFVDGLYDSRKRPSMSDWLDILERLYNDSFVCENCGEEHFLDTKDKICGVCKQELLKPIFIQSDKAVPLFNGMTIYSDDIWATTAHYEVFKVVPTKYDGRMGLQLMILDRANLKLAGGDVKTFVNGEAIPIFLDSEIEIESHNIKFI